MKYENKLTEAQVERLLELAAEGYTQQAIATHYGVHQSTVARYLRRRRGPRRNLGPVPATG